jgi:hypothetical protein
MNCTNNQPQLLCSWFPRVLLSTGFRVCPVSFRVLLESKLGMSHVKYSKIVSTCVRLLGYHRFGRVYLASINKPVRSIIVGHCDLGG